MSDEETPPNQHPAVKSNHEMTITDFRLQAVEIALRDHTKEFKRFLDRAHEQDTARIIANERCISHGKTLEDLREEKDKEVFDLNKRISHLGPKVSNNRTLWTAIAALGSGIGAWLTAYFHKGG
jgi:hypothetical protein